MSPAGFELTVVQHKFVPPKADGVDALLRVTAHDVASVAGTPTEAAQVLLVDCSGSMFNPPSKIAAARRATAAAVDALRDGVHFAIVAGTDQARMVYPSSESTVRASTQTKAEAKRAAARLDASGPTTISRWLLLARSLLARHPTAVRHAVLLTDGHNIGETEADLDRVLQACAGHFLCDARGIGDDWSPKELRRIVSVLRGVADAVHESELVDDFRNMTTEAMGKTVPELRLRIRTMPHARVGSARQVHPTEIDLLEHATKLDEHTTELSIGSWGHGTRDFQVRVAVDDHDPVLNEDIQVAIVQLVEPADMGRAPAGDPSPILVYRTEDEVMSSQLDPSIEHYRVQAELARVIYEGVDAFDSGRRSEAESCFGEAVRLATLSGNVELLRRLHAVVTTVNASSGLVRINPGVRREDVLALDVGADHSTIGPGAARVRPTPAAEPEGPDRVCPTCDRIEPAHHQACEACGASLAPQHGQAP